MEKDRAQRQEQSMDAVPTASTIRRLQHHSVADAIRVRTNETCHLEMHRGSDWRASDEQLRAVGEDLWRSLQRLLLETIFRVVLSDALRGTTRSFRVVDMFKMHQL